MEKLLLATALITLATPAFAKDYTVKEITDPDNTDRPYYFEPDNLTIQPGDTVTFVNAQDDMHDVMFDVVPKDVTEAMIMGPMFEQKGEKWSYTFTVPGSYHFHCHPHEALGMQGNLIVGQASAEGDTKMVDHEKMEHHMKGMEHEHMHDTDDMDHDHHATNALPEGTGKIVSINAKKHTINMTHEPIEALKWPAMTMDFSVSEDVDLSKFKADDMVEFILKMDENSQYSIVEMEPVRKHSH